ncbi:helix-turn-helix transcriptional regulator [Cyanobacterium aponinum UTEX 3222]|uniref:helix-turn-helix transcriptional regulator n=1 Tax=Cyanobacterium aponinum TaxID=379064 RepID=UPI00309220AE|nr:helix-turn-helix transcriptional regulator [Cyanobacterium aponinum UTEX 3222]
MRKKSIVKQLREDANLTQSQLAVAIGVATTTISRWEQLGNKGTEPAMTASEWMRFCRAVGIQWSDVPKYFIYQTSELLEHAS